MIGNYHFPANLALSIQHCGRILVEWIPKYYDTERVARIMGEDGKHELIKLNPNQDRAIEPELDQMGNEIGSIYNLNVGKYDVTVSTGPSYTSKRQEAADQQVQIIQARPELLEVIGDIAFRNMDSPGSDEIAERLEKLLPPPIQELLAGKDKTPIPPKVQMMMQQVKQAQQQIQEQGEMLKQAEMEVQKQSQDVSMDKSEVSAAAKELASSRKVFMAEVRAEQSKLELMGNKLADSLENIVDPIARDLAEKAAQMRNEEGEPEQDDALQEVLENLAEMSVQSQITMAEIVSQAMERITSLVSAPRETVLNYDDDGNPVSSLSTLQ